MKQSNHGEPWKKCSVCPTYFQQFKDPKDFAEHLRERHCIKEGGSFVCRYGFKNVCQSLPLEGVSDQDYEAHIMKKHVLDDFSYKNLSGPQNAETVAGSERVSVGKSSQPNLLTDMNRWTVYDSGQNLPAVLNDPRRTKRESDFFTKTWGDDFIEHTAIPIPHHLPEVNREHFDKYLKRIKKRFKQNAHKMAPLSRKCIATFGGKSFPDIDSIPKIFMQSNFNLEDAATFNTVLPWSQIQQEISTTAKNSLKPSIKLLQEKLSHYLDTIEVQIAHQISLRSDAFFQAMTSHDALMEQLTQNIQAVGTLRQKVHEVDETYVKKPLSALKLKQRRSNKVQVYNKLKLMATVHQTQPTIQLLLSTSEFVGALDLISTTQDIAERELVGIHSFRHLSSQMAEIRKLIDRMMEADFIRFCTGDLNRPITEDVQILEEDHLIAIIFGMLRSGNYSFIEMYKEEACTTVRTIVKQTVIEAISQEDVEFDLADKGSTNQELRGMSFSSWLTLFQQIFENVVKVLKRIKAVQQVMINSVVNATAGTLAEQALCEYNVAGEAMISGVDGRRLKMLLEDLLTTVCEHANEGCVKLLTARSRDGSLEKLTSSEFVALARSIEDFTSECTELSNKPSATLRLALQSQANMFIIRFHEEKKFKLSTTLDSEQWKQVHVPFEFQYLVDHLLETGTLSIPQKPLPEDINSTKPRHHLHIEADKYAVVSTVLLLLKILVEYSECAKDIPFLARDLLTRLVDLLKFFNSRTCQLLLGAGALKMVGLKTITTKHLALALRCLQLVIHYIPLVRSHFHSVLPPKQQQLLKHLDEVLKDYNNHVGELFNKLLKIVESVLDSQLSKWEAKAPVPSSCFRSISKHLIKLNEAVSEFLPQDKLCFLFQMVHQSFKDKLATHLARLNVDNDGGPQHGLVAQELTFYVENLKKLNLDLNLNVEDLWVSR